MSGTGAGRRIVITPTTATFTGLSPRSIPSSSPGDGSFILEDKEKRWLVVGICLNKILLPALRQYLDPEMMKHYHTMKITFKIHSQKYPAQLPKDKTFQFNYGSINNNDTNHKKKVADYDYNVTSSIDLAKLYLKPNMAKLSGFDNSCDMSAALGILAGASVFSTAIQKNATDIRQDVRNEWGHCNFDNWDEIKFARCFQLMDTFLRNLTLSHREEKRLTDELSDWETKGLQLCMGNLVDADSMKLVKDEVANLSREVELIQQNNEEEAHRVTSELRKVQDTIHEYETELAKVKEQVVSLELSRDQHSRQLEDLSGACADLSTDVGYLKSCQDDIEIEVSGVKKEQEKLSGRIETVEEKQEDLEGRVGALEMGPIRIPQSINTFQVPNRIPCFCGRTEELRALAKPLEVTATPCSLSVICGLGGTGKTSLAIEHVWINRDAYSGGVFWISGENQRLFQISITEMAHQIGAFADELTQTLSNTLHWLQTRGQYWCLVIDNLDELELSEDMLKLLHGHWKRQAAGHIIITTRREKELLIEEIYDVEQEGCIELTNLSESESLLFMKMRTERTENEEDSVTIELVRELGCLPLALDQAAAYIRYLHCTFSDYRKQYRKQTLSLLKRQKARYPAQNTSPDRRSVISTWELNFEYVCRLSEDMKLGRAAPLVMEVSAFLSPDDIPHEIINEGLPKVTDEHLRECASSSFGVSEMLTLLTNFSLFQRFTDNSYSVHRLVQEVIRSRIKKSDLKDVLLSATRMLNFAFSQTKTPFEVCQNFEGEAVFSEANPPSLHLWGKLGAHACVLQDHLLQYSQKDQSFKKSLLYTVEAVRLLSEASVFLSVCQEKIKAQELQRLKLEFLVHIPEHSVEQHLDYLKYFEIPLKNKDYKLISHCMAQEGVTVVGEPVNEILLQEKADYIREEGNAAAKKNDFKKALELYTKAINIVQTDHRLFSNRALCHLKLGQPSKAFEDCEKCLRLKKMYSKALQRKAWALQELANRQTDNKHLKGRSLAAAALAVYTDPTACDTPRFKLMFPNLHFDEVKHPLLLPGLLLKCAPETTLLLHNGDYKLQGVICKNGFQIVGLGSKVSLKFEYSCLLTLHNYCFENIILSKGSQAIVCSTFGSLTLVSCTISSGSVGCEDFPECNGGPGCVVGKLAGRKPCDRTGKFGDKQSGVSGEVGYAGVQISEGSSGYIEDCDILDCGGGGALCTGGGSSMTVRSCRVHKNHQAGLEAREGGCLVVNDSDIFANRYHGVSIGPSAGTCEIINNRIFENHGEGILVIKSLDHEVVICDNRIYHNRPFGISLDHCQVKIARNEIFENGFWAIYAKTLTTAYIEHNDIYSNKCGGIRIGVNFSGRIIILSNNVRDHSGSWLDVATFVKSIPDFGDSRNEECVLFLPPGETKFYSTPPVINNNELKNNKEGLFHPKEKAKSVKRECAFCRSSVNLLICSKCNVAAYCGPSCQEEHWPKHKALCAVMAGRYSVTVTPMSYYNVLSADRALRIFSSHLKGIGKGPKPEPKTKKRFIVKVQTATLNCHPLQLLSVYDQSLDIDCRIQSPDIFHVVMECGVLGQLNTSTSKKAFFWTMFAEGGKKLTIFLDKLAPYQEW